MLRLDLHPNNLGEGKEKKHNRLLILFIIVLWLEKVPCLGYFCGFTLLAIWEDGDPLAKLSCLLTSACFE